MPSDDTYRQPSGPASAETKVRGSRFLAEVFPAPDAEAAAGVAADARRRHHDAKHHASAWRVGPTGDRFRFDDDGEPSGTAGAPILRQIDAVGLTNVVVVVTRWFGGIRLGTGGLARAYGEAAREALARAPVQERVEQTRFRIAFSYADTAAAMHALARFDAETTETAYGEGTVMTVAVRRSRAEAFAAAWVDALGGRGTIRGIS